MTGRSTEAAEFEGGVDARDEAALPFQDAAKEQSDLRFLKRFEPKAPPPDRARPASALSTPENFIAESSFKRLSHRLFGHGIRMPAAGLAAVVAVLAASPIGLWLAAAPEAAGPAARPPEASPVREGAEAEAPPSLRVEAGEGPAAPTRSLGIEPVTAAAAREGALRASPDTPREEPPRRFADLADSAPELPSHLFAFASPRTGVTAFPPMLPAGAAAVEAAIPEPAGEAARAAARPERDQLKLDALIERGHQLLSKGEIAGARLFFERAVAQDDPRGALGLARSHDPLVLKGLAVVGLSGNDAEADRWYRKARELGGPAEAVASAAPAER